MPRHLGSDYDSLNVSTSTASDQSGSAEHPPNHLGYGTLAPGDLADHSTWDPTMSEAVLPSPSNELYHPEVDEIHAANYSKINAAEELVTLLQSKLGEGEAGRWEGDTHSPHSYSERLASLEALGAYCHYFWLEPHHLHYRPEQKLSDVQETQSCQPSEVSPISQKMLWYGMDASDVIASEQSGDHTSVPSHVQVRHHDGVARRVNAWGDYSILKDIEVVQQYIARCKAEEAAS